MWYFIGVLVAVLIVGLIYLGWNQWYRYDDAADFQGEWVSQETGYPVVITDSQIVFNSSTAYDYTLDTFSKTVTFTFKDYSGSGSYAFSEERDTLVIVERGEQSGTQVTTLVKASALYDSASEGEASSAKGGSAGAEGAAGADGSGVEGYAAAGAAGEGASTNG
ncbi:MAG: hypothetical protein ACI4BI_05480 [Anaerotardibacter sp.]